jgi:hypothetical protein
MIVLIFAKISPFIHILLATGLLDILAHRHRNDDILIDLINALPGNSSVNMVQQATIDEALFSMLFPPHQLLVTDQ